MVALAESQGLLFPAFNMVAYNHLFLDLTLLFRPLLAQTCEQHTDIHTGKTYTKINLKSYALIKYLLDENGWNQRSL